MKRSTAVIAILFVILLLAGCGGPQEVGICVRDKDDPAAGQLRQSLEQALIQAGYAVKVSDAGNDQSKQDQQIRELIEDKVDLLIVEPVMITTADQTVQQAKNANVPLVFINHAPERTVLDSWDKVCYVGYDAAQSGALQGQMCLELPQQGDLNGDGILSYVMIAGPEDHLDAQLRTQTCEAALADGGLAYTALATEYGAWTRVDAQRRCAQLLAKFGKDIEVIFCNSDVLALGAMDAIKDGGRTVGKNIYLLGIDGDKQAMLLVKSADMTGTVSLDIPGQTACVISAVTALLSGSGVEKVQYVQQMAVSQENVEAYLTE